MLDRPDDESPELVGDVSSPVGRVLGCCRRTAELLVVNLDQPEVDRYFT